MSAPVDVLADLRKIADGEGDAELLAMRASAAIAELMAVQKRLVAWNHDVNGGGEELGEICRDAETALRACGGAL